MLIQKPMYDFPIPQSDWPVDSVPDKIAVLRSLFPDAMPGVNVRSPSLKWRLTSAMQKAFRRGQLDRMIRYMAGLLQIDPNYAWRRFCVVVMEDGGPHAVKVNEMDLCVLMYLARGKKVRAMHGVENDDLIRFGMLFGSRDRDRWVCDLECTRWYHPKREEWAAGLAAPQDYTNAVGTIEQGMLLSIAASAKTNSTVATAALAYRLKFTPEATYLACEGVRQRQGGMFPIYGLLKDDSITACDEPMPPSEMIGAYPTECFDMHTSDGKRAIRYFLAMKDVPVVKTLTEIYADDREKMARGMSEFLFWAEVGRLARRRGGGMECSRQAQDNAMEACASTRGMPLDMVPTMKQQMWAAIPQLNYARKKVIEP